MSTPRDQLRELIATEAAERMLTQVEPGGGDNLLTWLRNSPVHIAEYLAMAKLNTDLTHVAAAIDYSLETLISEVEESSNVVTMPSRDLRGSDAERRRPRYPHGAFTALSLAMLLALATLVALTMDKPNASNLQRYTTAHGEERVVRLADGTFVHLNTDTTLTVSFLPDIRLVELERGEAYFEVARASTRPFRVRVGATEVQDLGTAFDVFRKSFGTVIAVAEGQVRILKEGTVAPAKAFGRSTDLKAGQLATISNSGALEIRSADLAQVMAWTKQQILFDQKPIGEIVEEFNRYNDVPIVVRDSQIARIAITGNFGVRDERAFVSFLTHLPGVRTAEIGGTIMVSAK